jgi:hypothetical protein
MVGRLEALQKEIESLKTQRKGIDKHIQFSQLPEGEQFKVLKKSGKQFVDTVKMIAYRAETAMVNILREYIGKKDEARTSVRQIFMTDADIEPDEKDGTLKIKLHNMTNPRNNQYVQQLCKILTESETIFFSTNLRLTYEWYQIHFQQVRSSEVMSFTNSKMRIAGITSSNMDKRLALNYDKYHNLYTHQRITPTKINRSASIFFPICSKAKA